MAEEVDGAMASEEQASAEHGKSLLCAAEAAPGCYRTAPVSLQKETMAPRLREGHSVRVSLCLCRAIQLHSEYPAAAICERASTTLAPFLGPRLQPYDLAAR
jgi:hypothetical protein